MEETKTPLRGYKVFNPDMSCNPNGNFFQYEVGKEYKFDGEIEICKKGFHFCLKASDCFSYYTFDPKNKVCEVLALGLTLTHSNDSKICTNHIHIVRELPWHEVLMVSNEGMNNTGHRNSGDSNSGDRNSGNWNSGNRNSGDSNSGDSNSGDSNSGDSNSGNRNSGNRNSGNWNSGNRNSGDSNSGYRNSGAFCTEENPTLWLFNKPTKITVREWEGSKAMQIKNKLLENTIWVYSENMTSEEKENYPSHETTGGYLKVKTLHEAWADMWGNLKDKEKKVFTDLPNFDAEIFFEITGIKV